MIVPTFNEAAIFLALGGLSKFTNVFLAFGLLAYLLAASERRAYFLTRLPYTEAPQVKDAKRRRSRAEKSS